MNKIEKKIEEALTGRFKLAAALQKREQERKAKDEARAAREKQQQQPVKETVEPIDEISTKALQAYRQAAHTQIQHSKFGAGKDKPEAGDVIAKREKGMASATAKVIAKDAANRKPMTPQKTTPYKPLGGRDEKSGRSYSESVEQMDELSKKTLGSYAVKAKGEMGLSAMAAGAQGARGDTIGKSIDMAHAKKRSKGVDNAIKRLTKEEINLDEAVTVKKEKYSWGKMVTVHHGSETSYPLHPEHQAAIKKLRPGMKTTFKDETNSTVHASREGDMVHLHRPKTSNKLTSVAYSHFDEQVELGFKHFRASLIEKTLTPAEMKKREEVAKAIEREKPNMPMGMKMAIATKTAKRVAEEVDDEGKMAKGQLMRMVNQASALAQMMDDDKQLDGWVQSKLTMASDYLDSVHDYLMHNKQDVDEMEEEVKDEYARKVDKYLKKKYNKEETVVETKGAPKGFHFTRDGKLKRGDANQDGDGGPMLRSDPLDKQRNKIPAVSEASEGEHLCAKHVRSQLLGDGVVIEAQHADPDENGDIEWYMVEFKTGIHKVYTEDLIVMHEMMHGNHKKKKRMTNG